MCCFHLHFSDFNVLIFYKKNLKNLLQFTFEKISYCAEREKKITCRQEKYNPPHPTGYQTVRPLVKIKTSENVCSLFPHNNLLNRHICQGPDQNPAQF